MRNAAPVLTIAAFAVLIIVLPLLYFGAYYAMLDGRIETGTTLGIPITSDPTGPELISWEDDSPSYRWEGESLERFFYIANEVDKRLRPNDWRKARTEVFP